MKSVVLLREAQSDIRRAANYYEQSAPGLGREFIAEVKWTLERLGAYPEIGVLTRYSARKFPMRRFPYSIIYRVQIDYVLALAVTHQKRHPDFWLKRE